MSLIYSLYIINKSGGLIFSRVRCGGGGWAALPSVWGATARALRVVAARRGRRHSS